MSQGNRKAPNSLLALSSVAILAVYMAGYSRTRSAADRFAVQAEERRPAIPVARGAAAPLEPATIVSPAVSAPSAPKREAAARPAVTASSRPSPATAEVSSATSAPVPSPLEPPPPAIAEPQAEQKAEAPAAAPVVPAAPAAPPPTVWKDGTYTGWGYSRHGDIQAAVVIEGGRIASATIAQCHTRYSCSVIEKLPPQVAERQKPDVDFVSGATQSADAFYFAVIEALAKAK